jgi:hypothetical protein
MTSHALCVQRSTAAYYYIILALAELPGNDQKR